MADNHLDGDVDTELQDIALSGPEVIKLFFMLNSAESDL